LGEADEELMEVVVVVGGECGGAVGGVEKGACQDPVADDHLGRGDAGTVGVVGVLTGLTRRAEVSGPLVAELIGVGPKGIGPMGEGASPALCASGTSVEKVGTQVGTIVFVSEGPSFVQPGPIHGLRVKYQVAGGWTDLLVDVMGGARTEDRVAGTVRVGSCAGAVGRRATNRTAAWVLGLSAKGKPQFIEDGLLVEGWIFDGGCRRITGMGQDAGKQNVVGGERGWRS
jgi:hypothetical protein